MDPFDPIRVAMVLQDLGGQMDTAAALGKELRRRHAEPHRRYHTAEHVGEVLAEVLRLLELEAAQRGDAARWSITVHAAALFHDAVHDVHASGGASEEASAQLALDRLAAAGIAPDGPVAGEVARLIRLTAGHAVEPDDGAGALLVDADLWILSSPPSRYDRYAADVRHEYGHLLDDMWATGRSAVLRHFLDAVGGAEGVGDRGGGLYRAGPPADRAARRSRAAANLTRELATLAHP